MKNCKGGVIPKIAYASLLFSLLFFSFQLNAQALELFGTIDNHLVTINTTSGLATSVGTFSPSLQPLGNLTYHSGIGQLLAVANAASSNPRLVSLDRATGQATIIGTIVLNPPGTNSELMEGLAYNPLDGLLYGTLDTIGLPTNAWSRILVTVNPGTGVATKIANISGTCNGEGDALVWANGSFYVLDGCPNPNVFYSLNPTNGVGTQIGITGTAGLNDMAYNPGNNQVYGINASKQVFTINTSNASISVIGNTHTSSQFNGANVGGLSFAPPAGSQPVPALSEWGLIILGLLVLSLGAIAIRRRARNSLALKA